MDQRSKLNQKADQFSKDKLAQKPADKSFSHKAGDAIERAGEKLKGMGAQKVGDAVYKTGNKIEHSEDRKRK